MNKKLKLNQIQVRSFRTSEAESIKGGLLETHYSCLKILTCDLAACAVSLQGNICPTGTIG
ncbi:MAG: pinensin family lanthipeptide [Bacteroidota bacterium]